jgi:hypothetical protein
MIFTNDIRLILHSGAGFSSIESVSVRLCNASMVVLIRTPPLFNVDSMKANSSSFAIVHEEVTSSPDSSLSDLGESWLQIGNLSYPKTQSWTLCVTQGKWEGCFDIRFPGAMEVKSISILVPFDGNYSLSGSSELERGYFVTPTNDPFLNVTSLDSFIPAAHFISFATHLTVPATSTALTASATATESGTNSFLPIWSIAVGSIAALIVIHRLAITVACWRLRRQTASAALPEDSSVPGLREVDVLDWDAITVGKRLA